MEYSCTVWFVYSFKLLIANGIHKKFAEKKEGRVRKAEERQESKAKPPSTRRSKKNKVTNAATHTTYIAAVTLNESVSPMTDYY